MNYLFINSTFTMDSLMLYYIIFTSVALVVLFYLLMRINKALTHLLHQVEIKSVKLDIIEDMLSVGIYVADSAGKWTYVNNTMALLMGMQPVEMTGNGWLRNILDRENVHSKWMNAIKNRMPYSDTIAINKHGRITEFELTTLPVLSNGEFSAYVGTIKIVIPQTQ